MILFQKAYLAALFALSIAALGFTENSANASDCQQQRYYTKTVTCYEPVRYPVVKWETRYDHCGDPYRVKVVSYKIVIVPVEKQVRIAF